jgi:hypothetical protein
MFEKKEKKGDKVAEILKKAAKNEPLTPEEFEIYAQEVNK